MSIEVFSTPTCGYCHQLKAYLRQRGVPFTDYDVSQDRNAAMRMVQVSGQQGVPVTLIDGQVVVGFNRPAIDQLLVQQAARPPRLGAAVADAGRIAAKKKLDLPAGAYVGKVQAGSPAAAAGLQVGDVITELANETVRAGGDVDRALAQVRAGQLVNLNVWRDGYTVALMVQF